VIVTALRQILINNSETDFSALKNVGPCLDIYHQFIFIIDFLRFALAECLSLLNRVAGGIMHSKNNYF
jgi:hypothetical protein